MKWQLARIFGNGLGLEVGRNQDNVHGWMPHTSTQEQQTGRLGPARHRNSTKTSNFCGKLAKDIVLFVAKLARVERRLETRVFWCFWICIRIAIVSYRRLRMRSFYRTNSTSYILSILSSCQLQLQPICTTIGNH